MEPNRLPALHKRPPPEGTRLGTEFKRVLSVEEPTSDDKRIMWAKYQAALDE